MMKKKKKNVRWSFAAYDPYTDQQIVKVKNLTDDQFDLAVKEFRKKFR
jgi:hypothetical protein